jgi:fibronectin type 3 domain-containing protein
MQVVLSWTAVPNALYYNVYRGTSTGGPYLKIAQSNPAAGGAMTTYTDGPGNLSNGQDYFYVTAAVTSDGESPYSNEFHAVAPTAPTSPTVSGVVT